MNMSATPTCAGHGFYRLHVNLDDLVDVDLEHDELTVDDRTLRCGQCAAAVKLVQDDRTGRTGWSCPDRSCANSRRLLRTAEQIHRDRRAAIADLRRELIIPVRGQYAADLMGDRPDDRYAVIISRPVTGLHVADTVARYTDAPTDAVAVVDLDTRLIVAGDMPR
jgi:hypothetical protein